MDSQMPGSGTWVAVRTPSAQAASSKSRCAGVARAPEKGWFQGLWGKLVQLTGQKAVLGCGARIRGDLSCRVCVSVVTYCVPR